MAAMRALLGGAGIGAGLMYFFDPVDGRRRRALIRDQLRHWLGKSDDALAATARDMANRARGLLAMLARALTNRELRLLLGVGGGPEAVTIHKTLSIGAPLGTVFDFWTDYERLPTVMTKVRAVRDLGAGRSHWIAAGPAGTMVEWDAELTQLVPNEIVAWRTLPGSRVQHAGVIRFQAEGPDSTRVDIRLSYNPPGGVLGHAIAWLFGHDPKSELDADPRRMKSALESGRAPHDASAPEATYH